MSDFLIVQRRKMEDRRAAEVASTKYYAKTSEQSQFEAKTSLKIDRNKLVATFNTYKNQSEQSLLERKEKLRELVVNDEIGYREELIVTEETKEERIERMKSRMNELKQKRETERLGIVQERLLKQWRNGNDELKVIKSKLIEKRVAAGRDIQLIEQSKRRDEAVKEKEHYDELYEKDRQFKIQRELHDAARTTALNADMVKKLAEQLTMLQKHKVEEERLVEEDRRLMRQAADVQALYESRAHAANLNAQRVMRADLDACNSKRIADRAAEVKAALEMDISIVSEFVKIDEVDRNEKNRKREELRRDMLDYRKHLEEMREYERLRDAEINGMYRDEEQKIWRARSQKWDKESAAREKLMVDVLAGRQEQLRFAAEQNNIRIMQNRLETETLLRSIENAKAANTAARAGETEKSMKYGRDLSHQIKSAEERKVLAMQEVTLEEQSQRDLEEHFQNLLTVETQRLYDDFDDEFQKQY